MCLTRKKQFSSGIVILFRNIINKRFSYCQSEVIHIFVKFSIIALEILDYL